jgi:hypothetical protein
MSGSPTPRLPSLAERWRCAGCGNLTRFDVVRTRRTAEYWHVDLAGRPQVENVQALDEKVASVTCRWCGRSDAIELVTRKVDDTG